MLVIDDFNELVGLETLFRRLGFDVLSLGRESLVPEAILGFPADLTIATGQGRHVDGLHLAPKLRYGNSQSKLVVLLPLRDAEHGAHPGLSYADVDAVIETPFEPRAALRVVAVLLNLAAEPLLEKYTKIVGARLFEPQELKIIKNPVAPSTNIIHVTTAEDVARPVVHVPPPLSAREARYAKFLDDKAEEELPPLASHETMRDARKKLEEQEAKASIEEAQKIAKLAREKREFVRAMLEAREADRPAEIIRGLPSEKKSSDSNGQNS